MTWASATILPGLVASGGALLFGVNAWCLDGRGLLWRESLPARPDQVFAARAIVLAEFVLVATLLTLALAAVRAGLPSPAELAAIVMLVAVVTVQVIAAAMRWSAQRPFPVDMRSARADPRPTRRDDRLLLPPRALDDLHRPVLLVPRAGPTTGAWPSCSPSPSSPGPRTASSAPASSGSTPSSAPGSSSPSRRRAGRVPGRPGIR